MRKRHEALVQDCQAADPGVEDGNWKRSLGRRHDRTWSQDRRAWRRRAALSVQNSTSFTTDQVKELGDAIIGKCWSRSSWPVSWPP